MGCPDGLFGNDVLDLSSCISYKGIVSKPLIFNYPPSPNYLDTSGSVQQYFGWGIVIIRLFKLECLFLFFYVCMCVCVLTAGCQSSCGCGSCSPHSLDDPFLGQGLEQESSPSNSQRLCVRLGLVHIDPQN